MAGTVNEEALKLRQNLDKVYAAGKDEFWNAYQQNGNRTDYTYAFAGSAWTEDTFYPKYNLTVKTGVGMFAYSVISGSLKDRLEEQGITLTFPQASGINNLFNNASRITEIGELDFSTCATTLTAPNTMFNGCRQLHTIEKLVLPATFESYGSWFGNCTALANITIEGVINGTMNLQACPLTVDSMKSIITHLANFKDTSSAYTQKITFNTDCWTALGAENVSKPKDDGVWTEDGTWQDYVFNELCWEY